MIAGVDLPGAFEQPLYICWYSLHFLTCSPVGSFVQSRRSHPLFLAGRHISVSHAAFASVRVMRTLGVLGEVTGMAASLCAKHNITPRELYGSRFQELKAMMEKGVPPPSTYHPGGFGTPYEGYHFKDTGHLGVYPKRSPRLDEPGVRTRIEALGVQHADPEKYKP